MSISGLHPLVVGRTAQRHLSSTDDEVPLLSLLSHPLFSLPYSLHQAERIQKAGGLYMNFVSDQSLSYLDGTLPGDFGFDPLGLSDPEGAGGFITPEWLAYSEVIHCRWAMLGAAGCIAPEILASVGAIPQSPEEAIWFHSGVIPPAGSYSKFWADPYTLFTVEIVLMQFAELRRWQDFKNPGSMGKQYFLGLEGFMKGSGNPAYPGGPFFNFAGFGKDEASMNKLKTNEIRNGRLAMLAMFGFGSQAVMTGEGPFKNLLDHLSDPTHHNMLTNFGSVLGQH
jgi:light-harvesting complex I chlorophyll a/b binding protein 3